MTFTSAERQLATAQETQRGDQSSRLPNLFCLPNPLPPSPALAGIIESISDWDLPDAEVARNLGIQVLPSVSPYLIVQYRLSMGSVRQFAQVSRPHAAYRHVITNVHTGIVTIRLGGPLGAVIVRLKPEAVTRLVGERMRDFMDVKIALEDLFDRAQVALLEEMVSAAQDSGERLALVERFLLKNLRRREPHPTLCRAVALLRHKPSLPVHRVAAQLDVSERHLSRSFCAMFGTAPKHFARIARIEKALAARVAGSPWADVAYSCGFTDQAHMINDFNAIIGAPPGEVLRPQLVTKRADLQYFSWRDFAPARRADDGSDHRVSRRKLDF